LSIERRNFPQFFITTAAPCPYLPDRVERKVFTHLINTDACRLHNTLTQSGFRRSQNIAYRPACDGCSACVSVRVPVATFKPTRGFRRIMQRNKDLQTLIVPAKANSEHYALFRDYIYERHDDGGMADMSMTDFSSMIEESYVDTRLVEYRLAGDISLSGPFPPRGPLIATALTDVMEDGLSMIYSYYDTSQAARSLGTFMILDHIARSKAMGLPYVYLGYWVNGSHKMDYKSRFLPQERLGENGWELCVE
jgi:arginine-tRNA-protein transferase